MAKLECFNFEKIYTLVYFSEGSHKPTKLLTLKYSIWL
jgi:hypothetical protein